MSWVKNKIVNNIIGISLSVALIAQPIIVEAQSISIPAPGTMLALSQPFTPVLIKGISLDRQNPLQLEFFMDVGDTQLDISSQKFKEESNKLIKYFLAALAVPEEEMWVNLSPYEKGRIIPKAFGKTEMGRDLLAQDYLLKQITSSLIYPEDGLGKEFWDKVYDQVQKKFGTTDIPADTFNKIWIIPDKATLYQNKNSIFTVENHLKVMLEEDYLAISKNSTDGLDINNSDSGLRSISSDILREIIIPVIEKEVNRGKNFANLRQIYSAMILATWYKRNLKTSLLGQIYVDHNKIGSLEYSKGPLQSPDDIYQQYVNAFRAGVFNFIKEEYDAQTQEVIPRKYFSGGTGSYQDLAMSTTSDPKGLQSFSGAKVKAKLDQAMTSSDSSRVWAALEQGQPIISQASSNEIRLYFLEQDLHIYLSQYFGDERLHISNMGGDYQHPGYRYEGDSPGEEIEVTAEERGRISARIRSLLSQLRDSDKGIDRFLEIAENNEKERQRMNALKEQYRATVVKNSDQRREIISELSDLLDVSLADMDSKQIERMQQLAAQLGYDPFYALEEHPIDETPHRPVDPNIFRVKQGGIIYIQYDKVDQNTRRIVRTGEIEGYVLSIDTLGHPYGNQEGNPRNVTLRDGTVIPLGTILDIIVDGGEGGYYSGGSYLGSSEVDTFLNGGRLDQNTLRGKEGEPLYKGSARLARSERWPGVDLNLKMKFITAVWQTREEAKSWMVGEKVTVMEPPSEENNQILIYKKRDGSLGHTSAHGINRVCHLGFDDSVGQLKTHHFQVEDRVVAMFGDEFHEGTVESFYMEPFVGRGMIVRLNEPVQSQERIRVEFVTELGNVLTEAKNEASKEVVQASLQELFNLLNDVITPAQHSTTTTRFLEQFNQFYEALFGEEAIFNREDFNVAALNSIFVHFTENTLDNFLAGLGEGTNYVIPMEIRGTLGSQEISRLNGLRRQVSVAVSLFSGKKVSSTGTSPWTVKEELFEGVIRGQAPESDFTLAALFRYFQDQYQGFINRLNLAKDLATMREKIALRELIEEIEDSRDGIDDLSRSAREMAAEEFINRLTDPDDIGIIKLIFDIDQAMVGETSSFSKNHFQKGGIDFNAVNLDLIVQNAMQNCDENSDNELNCFEFNFSQEQIDQIHQSINGLAPVIINIQPVLNLSQLLGLKDEDSQETSQELVLGKLD